MKRSAVISVIAILFLVMFFSIWKKMSYTLEFQSRDMNTNSMVVMSQSLTQSSEGWREISGNSVEEIKKLRWAFSVYTSALYRIVSGDSIDSPSEARLVIIFKHAVYAAIFCLTFIFVILYLNEDLELDSRVLFASSLIFAVISLYILSSGNWTEDYSPPEMLFIAIALFAARSHNIPLMIFASVLAPSVRETGLLVGGLYILFNGISPRSFLIASIAPTVFVALNAGTLADWNFYQMGVISPMGSPRPTIFDFWRYAPTQWAAFMIQTAILFGPAAYLLASGRLKRTDAPLLFTIGGYLCVLLFGTYLGNIFPFLLIAPVLTILYTRHFPGLRAKVNDRVEAGQIKKKGGL